MRDNSIKGRKTGMGVREEREEEKINK